MGDKYLMTQPGYLLLNSWEMGNIWGCFILALQVSVGRLEGHSIHSEITSLLF